MFNGDPGADGLSRVMERLVRRLRVPAGAQELTQAMTSALSRLDEEGPLGITQLARAEGVSQPSMTQLVDRMSNEGFVERRVPEGDRRSVHVNVTETGRAALNRRREHRAARLGQAIDALSESDRSAIISAVPALERLTAVLGPGGSNSIQSEEGNKE